MHSSFISITTEYGRCLSFQCLNLVNHNRNYSRNAITAPASPSAPKLPTPTFSPGFFVGPGVPLEVLLVFVTVAVGVWLVIVKLLLRVAELVLGPAVCVLVLVACTVTVEAPTIGVPPVM